MASTSAETWKRRILWMLLPLAVLAALLVGLLNQDDEPPAAPSPVVERPGTIKSAGGGDLGIEIAVPKGWKQTEIDAGLRIASPDGAADVTIVAAGEAQQRRQVVDIELAALETAYGGIETIGPSAGGADQIGAYPAVSTAVEINSDGESLRILIAAVSTQKRTYLIEVRYPPGGSVAALTEAQAALSTIVLD